MSCTNAIQTARQNEITEKKDNTTMPSKVKEYTEITQKRDTQNFRDGFIHNKNRSSLSKTQNIREILK